MDWTERFLKETAEELEEETKALKKAKSDACDLGKEPFDLERFESVYARSSPPWKATVEVRTREWERRYYLLCPTIKTIEGFARWVEMNDLYEGGDMHLDKW